LFFLSGRSRREKTTLLDMKKADRSENKITAPEPILSVEASGSLPPQPAALREVGPTSHASRSHSSQAGRKRYFVYNGHEWEAHEVLSVSAEANLVQLTERYQHLVRTSDPSTFEFYEAAYTALLSGRKK